MTDKEESKDEGLSKPAAKAAPVEEEKETLKAMPARGRKVSVQTISLRGGTALVQYTSKMGQVMQRCYVPAEEVDNGKVMEAVLAEGTPYGLDWAMVLNDIMPSAEDVVNALHQHNIWTAQDAMANPLQVSAAFASISNPLRRAVLQYASKEK